MPTRRYFRCAIVAVALTILRSTFGLRLADALLAAHRVHGGIWSNQTLSA